MEDFIFLGKYKKDIHDLDTKLRESRVYLEQEYDSDKCLGVTLECNKKMNSFICVNMY